MINIKLKILNEENNAPSRLFTNYYYMQLLYLYSKKLKELNSMEHQYAKEKCNRGGSILMMDIMIHNFIIKQLKIIRKKILI
jgi:hypothetical protein